MVPAVYVFPTTDALSQGLNEYVEKLSRDAIQNHGVVSVAISGGSLPKLLSKYVSQNSNIDFSKWHLFWADERCVDYESDDSNYKEVKKTLLDHVNIPEANIHAIHEPYARGKDAQKAAADYESKLKAFFNGKEPEFDLILLGMGPDGHCCSLFPGHPLLDDNQRWVASLTDSPKPPPERITLTYPVLNRAKSIVFVTAGEGKQEMVQKIIEQPQLQLPCQRVQPASGKVCWFIDNAAAGKLKNDSYTGFKL
ncbi:putative 6-phosphogluconolactonase [Radiomyces spectabilis]|uniref:putative 6-phosphogluconolactonase n=1 Tax=Radiomyces spectabilis TaxID=64574 RepID=UPI00221FEAB2|nr:putative 6-phosphogluconolactonase [Radiomyces spectabilis]KAI8377578.1 putative 6-phosphogluconolactonase [Radiomyces spectabilis]